MKNSKGFLRKAIAMLLTGVLVATAVPAGILDASAPADVYAVEKADNLLESQTADESTAQDELLEQTDENEDISESETLSDEEKDSTTEDEEESATEDETETLEDESTTEELSEELTEVSKKDAALADELLGDGETAVAKVKFGDEEQSFTDFGDALGSWMGKGAGAELVLLADVTTNSRISISGGTQDAPLILDLNGYGIRMTGSDGVLRIELESCLELRDSGSTENIRYITLNDNGRGTGVVSDKPGEGEKYVQISGGYITGGNYNAGITNYGTFIMTGGEICANEGVTGEIGGLGVFNRVDFIMTGGKIHCNKGCGVRNQGRFEMTGGEISGNGYTGSEGGGVYNYGYGEGGPFSFKMSGGKIIGNTAGWGGGVFNKTEVEYEQLSFEMSGGEIRGNTAGQGGGVYICAEDLENVITFKMNGGEISGNAADDGGGICNYAKKGSIISEMTGGKISGNTATNKGGGIHNVVNVDDTGNFNFESAISFEMSGGEISENTAADGGGVSLYKPKYGGTNKAGISFKMSDGIICKNIATGTSSSSGGGVYVNTDDYGDRHNGTMSLEINGGEISENTAEYGAGVYFRRYKNDNASSFEMNGGKISGNKATGYAYGGGILTNNTSLTMNAGEISENTANLGGGIYFGGVSTYTSFTLNGGVISGNTANSGGGVYNSDGKFEMTGGKIIGNTAANKGGGVYYSVSGNRSFKMTGGEISGNTASEGKAAYVNNTTANFEGTVCAGEAIDGSDAQPVSHEDAQNNINSYGYIRIIEFATVKAGEEEKVFKDFESAVDYWNEKGAEGVGAELKLLTDLETDSTIEVGGGTENTPMILDLNGHGILYTGGSNQNIRINSGKFLELKDTGNAETVRYIKLNEYGRGTGVVSTEPDEGDYVQISGGFIAGGNNCGILNNGTFTMNGGTICGNYSINGGGVSNNGTFTMTGGAICKNTATFDAGGGVYNNGTFILNGGDISDNTAMQKGGGIYNAGTFRMIAGEISNNTATDGKAVFNYEGTIAFDGSVCAGIATDGTDSKYVDAEDAVNDINTYGFITMSNLWHAPVENMTYTGSALVPEVKVYFGQRLLREKTDYTIKFTNNVKAGTEAKFTITGKGNYKGTISDTFEIVAKKISDVEVSVSAIAPAAYNKKKAYTPVPAITYNKKKLKKGTDFTVEYFSDEACNTKVTPKDGGKYYAKVTGIKNFTDSVVLPFEIAGSEQIAVSKLTIGKIPAQSYTGEALTPSLTIKNGKKELTSEEKEDIVIQYENNTKIGTASVTIAGKEGSKFVGKRTVTFQIAGILMNKVTVAGIPKKAVVYDGTEQKPAITLSYKANKKSAEQEIKCATQEQYDKELSADEQAEIGCIVSYANNKNVGTATVTLTGIHGCSGTVKKTFKITPFVVTNNEEDPFKVEAVPPCSYAKGGAKPVPVVTYKEIKLTEGVDYTVSYANNTAVNDGTGNKKPTVKVTGKGNFKGTDSSTTFAIVTADMEEAGVKVTANDVVFRNKAGKWKAKYTVAGPDGKALKAGTDYDKINVVYAYDADFNELITDSIVPAGKTIYMKVTAKGSSYSGSATGSYRILAPGHDISKLSVKIDPKEYTGREIRLTKSDIIWKSGKKAVENVDFVIDGSTYTNNIGKGKATVIVRGTGDWGGSKKITYKINAHGLKWWQRLFS